MYGQVGRYAVLSEASEIFFHSYDRGRQFLFVIVCNIYISISLLFLHSRPDIARPALFSLPLHAVDARPLSFHPVPLSSVYIYTYFGFGKSSSPLGRIII